MIHVSGHALMFDAMATLDVSLERDARPERQTGAGSVTVSASFGGGTFSGVKNGHDLLVTGTGLTTLYAGGDGDAPFASGGDRTILNGSGGNEIMSGAIYAGLPAVPARVGKSTGLPVLELDSLRSIPGVCGCAGRNGRSSALAVPPLTMRSDGKTGGRLCCAVAGTAARVASLI